MEIKFTKGAVNRLGRKSDPDLFRKLVEEFMEGKGSDVYDFQYLEKNYKVWKCKNVIVVQ